MKSFRLRYRWSVFIKEIKIKLRLIPTPTEMDMLQDWFLSQTLKYAERSAKKIGMDESFYDSARYAYLADHKKYFLYSCIRQAKKAAISLIGQKEFLSETPKDNQENEDATSLIIEAVNDEQYFWSRKLMETLINLINFSETNGEEAYCIFLNTESADLFLGKQKDFQDFYDFKSENVNHSIVGYKNRIIDNLKRMKRDDIWIINKKNLVRQKFPFLASLASRFKNALRNASDDEKIVIGASYHEVYGVSSISIHGGSKNSPIDIDFDNVRNKFNHIALLALHIMNRVNKLMDFDDPDGSWEKYLAEGSDASKLMSKNRRKFEVGDIVFAGNDLAEIIECKESKYGYTAYKAKFLNRPPIPEISGDWLPSDHVVKILAKRNARQFFNNNLQRMRQDYKKNLKDFLPKVEDMSDDQIYNALKSTFIKLGSEGILLNMYTKK